MTELEHLVAKLDEIAASRSVESTYAEVISLMEEAIALPSGLVTLVIRYAERSEPILLRPLSFLTAQTISREGPATGCTSLLYLLEHLHCDDESTRVNLASGLHLLAMHRALPQQPPPELALFLDQGLRGGPLLRDAVVPATAAILAAGVQFSESERELLRSALEPLEYQDPDWVTRALEALSKA